MKRNEIIFELENTSYIYPGDVIALDGVTLNIAAGERLVVMGSNGSGKSTLLKLLDGLYFPTRGQVKAFGHVLDEAAFQDDSFGVEFRRRVSLVFQDPDVQLFSPTVWDEVAFAPLQLDLPRAEVETRIERALSRLQIEKLRDRPPHRLSSGEKKKVSLASVLSLQPEVWLLDEPSAGLDPRSTGWLVDFVCELGEQGKTVIVATHDLDIVPIIATRVAILSEEHRLVAEDTPDKILSNEELLLRCNLIHEHRHRHAETEHAHRHLHEPGHAH